MIWSADCVIVYIVVANQGATFEITETKLYVPVVTLSTQDNTKLLQQLKSDFIIIINWNKYLSNPQLLAQNPNLNHLVESSFQAVNFCFTIWIWWSSKEQEQKKIFSSECRNYNVIIDGNFFFGSTSKKRLNKIWQH